MSLLDKATILKFHKDRIEEFGKGEVEALGWKAKENQLARFEVLAELTDFSGKSVLDIGCGHGDLFPFLLERFPTISYKGLDQMEDFLETASNRYIAYPQARFLWGDFWQADLPPSDIVIACGALSYRHSDPAFLHKMIKKLFSYAKEAFAFTLLSKVKDTEGLLVAYEAAAVYDYCRKICPNAVLKKDYRSDDFAVFMYK